MDPTKILNFECIEDIFCHLSGKVLLESALVSPRWNNFIGSTKSCMQKITLNLKDYESKKRIARSKRRYERALLEGLYCCDLQRFLLADWRKWTYIRVHSVEFDSIVYLLEFLGIIQSFVRELYLIHTEIQNIEDGENMVTSNLLFT